MYEPDNARCVSCAALISSQLPFCPHCGTRQHAGGQLQGDQVTYRSKGTDRPNDPRILEAPISKPIGTKAWLIIVLILCGVVGFFLFSSGVISLSDEPHIDRARADAPDQAPKMSVSKEAGAENAKRIAALQERGIYGNVRVSNHIVKVQVLPAWYLLDLETRKTLALVAYVWGQAEDDGNISWVAFEDSKSGEEAGTYTMRGGLKTK